MKFGARSLRDQINQGRITPQAFVAFAVILVLSASAAALVVVYGAGERIISERERAQALSERDLLDAVIVQIVFDDVNTYTSLEDDD